MITPHNKQMNEDVVKILLWIVLLSFGAFVFIMASGIAVILLELITKLILKK